MPWWNLYKTENEADRATIAAVDGQLAALDSARRERKEAEARQLEEIGLKEDADALRDALDEYDRGHAANIRTQNAALDYTSADAFDDELDARAGAFRDGVAGTIGTTLGTTFKLLPWWLWLALAAGVFIYVGGPRYLPKRKSA